ncbi:EamA-like transporter family protein [Halomonas sp. THAF5a]|uniref:drug/metabolite transporter n=1 Tax=Halomonas sp. THAF5a TaxID=2587844 RepID=UPI001268A0B8|nr:drug/metabolite transporter [Halomonas sp. THAF5a]QFU01151.1 EamA-like transporter family protein [Halomonas sp. THAF5a]
MSPAALGLVLLSVCLHAGWNLMGKGRAPSLAFFVLAMGGGALALAPLLWLGPSPAALPPAFWGWLVASGLCQMLYLGGLAWAYARGEISVLYPVARALPVVLVPLVSMAMLGSRALTPLDLAGMGLIVIGALCLPLTSPRALRPSTYLTPAFGFALLAAVATAGYSLIDNRALALMMASGHSSLTAGSHFMVLQALMTLAWGLPAVLLLPAERRRLAALRQGERSTIVLTGIMMLATYGLVLVAMALTEEVSLIVAMRQLSIPLGVLLGVWWLRERAAPAKWLGTALMLAGLWVVALP